MKKLIRRLFACLTAALLAACFAPAALALDLAGAAPTFEVEQAYINVPDADVFFYANDENGDPYSLTLLQAAGLELKLGDTELSTESVIQAGDATCYLFVLDNSDTIETEDFEEMAAALRRAVFNMNDDDQVTLYTTAGGIECVLEPTGDKDAAYDALDAVEQKEGSMDLTALLSQIYSDVESEFASLAPRKVLFACTHTNEMLSNLPLLGAMMTGSGVTDSLNMAVYAFAMTSMPEEFSALSDMTNGLLVVAERDKFSDTVRETQKKLATAFEIKTEVPESLYGTRIENLTLSVPQLGSAVQSSIVVTMNHKLEKPCVTKVQVTGRSKIELTFNQAVSANAVKPQFFRVYSDDIWNWRVKVNRVELSENGLSATLYTEPLYQGSYTVSLNKVASRMSAANVSDSDTETSFTIAVWPRDRAFYLARFRTPLILAAMLLLALVWFWLRGRRRERAAEQEAEAEHLLADALQPHLPRRWVTMFLSQKESIAENRWGGMVENSLILGSDAAQCDLCVNDRRVAPQHCALSLQGDGVLLTPLGKAVVTVNGERIAGDHRLQNDDTVRIGKTKIRFVL